jgi:hypothetical protein
VGEILDGMQVRLLLSRAWLPAIPTDFHTERKGLLERAKRRAVSQAIETSFHSILIWLAVVTNMRVHPIFTSLVWSPSTNIVMALLPKVLGMPIFDLS